MSDRRRELAASALIVAQIFLSDLDFGTVGLASEGSVDLVKWALLAPFWILPIFVLVATSAQLPRVVTSAPVSWMVAWASWGVLTVIWSYSPRQTILQGTAILTLLVTAAWFVSLYGFLRYARLFCVATIPFLALGLLRDLALGNFSIGGEARFVGLAFQPTNLARLALATVLLGWMLLDKTGLTRRIGQGAVGLGLVVLLGTNTRTVLVGLAVAVLYVLARRIGWRAVVPLIGLGALMLAVALSSLGGGSTTLSRSDGPAELSSFNGRTTIWPITIDLIQDRPLIGYGTGAGEDLWTETAKVGDIWWLAFNAHNIFLDITLSQGLIGLALFVGGLFSYFRRWRWSIDPRREALLIAIVVTGVTESILNRPSVTMSIIGALFAARTALQVQREHVTSTAQPVLAA